MNISLAFVTDAKRGSPFSRGLRVDNSSLLPYLRRRRENCDEAIYCRLQVTQTGLNFFSELRLASVDAASNKQKQALLAYSTTTTTTITNTHQQNSNNGQFRKRIRSLIINILTRWTHLPSRICLQSGWKCRNGHWPEMPQWRRPLRREASLEQDALAQ